MNWFGVVVGVLLLLGMCLFGVGAVILGLERTSRRYRSREQDRVDQVLEQEEKLEKLDANTVLCTSARSEEHSRRADELVAGARKRIRDRAREVVSRESSASDATGS